MAAIEPYQTPCFSINFQRMASTLTSVYNRHLEPCGVTVNQFSLLFHMRKLGPCNRSELAQFTQLDRTTIVRNVGTLERKGLVREDPGPTKRNGLLVLTDEGNATLDACLPVWKDVQALVSEAIGPNSLQRVADLGARISTLESSRG